MNISGRELLIFGLVVLVVFCGGLILLNLFFGAGYGTMMGPGMMGQDRMGGFGGSGGFGGFGLIPGLGGLLGCLTVLGLAALVGGGVAWLITSRSTGPSPESQPSERCPNCNRPVQVDWQNCPHCGTSLREEASGGNPL